MGPVIHQPHIASRPEPGPAPSGVYVGVDRSSGALLLAFLVLGPWLFGATERWSIWILNGLAYASGLLLVVKWIFRWRSGALAVQAVVARQDHHAAGGRLVVRGLAILTGLVLLFCLISALNAAATYHPDQQRFDYHLEQYVRWLPSSWDSTLSWQAFWDYCALACFFWALRDWLMHPAKPPAPGQIMPWTLPPHFQKLLWVVAVNATVIALIGLFQKLTGTDRLLWLRESYMGRGDLMYASFAFRGNAAQYLNLAWPTMLGFWWALRQKARGKAWDGGKVGGAPHVLLLPCAVLTAAAPMIALSRSGTIIMLACLGLTLFIFLWNRRATWRTRCTILLVSLSAVLLGGALAREELGPRLRELFRTPYANPNEVHENAKKMVLDYPWFGVGPGAFRSVYQLYREDPSQSWQTFVHDDWLETRVTFGWVGSFLILGMLALILAKWFLPGGVRAPWELVAMLWVSLGGCLGAAKFGFPLQVYSILALALAVACVLSCLCQPES